MPIEGAYSALHALSWISEVGLSEREGIRRRGKGKYRKVG